jgi:tetratricopeptide (TPR) repeat protein
MAQILQRTLGLKEPLIAALIGVLGIGLILSPSHTFFVPKTSKEIPWLFQLLSNWAERQSDLAWRRGGPEERPQGYLNKVKYYAQVALSHNAARERPMANYQLASCWLRLSLSLDNRNIGDWRLASFLASLSGDFKRAKKYLEEAMAYYPNNPLLLLERECIFGEYEPPRIDLMWAEEAYFAFEGIEDKSILNLQDLRSFFLQYMRALRRTDWKLKKPETRKKILSLYNELEKYDRAALSRSPLYKKLSSKIN